MRLFIATTVFTVAALSACDSPAPDEDADDHAPERGVYEGAELAALLGADGTSDPIRVDGGFRRLGVMWDVTDDDALEVRTSLDGTTWSSWVLPAVVTHEDIARAGHVDAIDLAGAGSIDSDPLAAWWQVRVAAGRATTSFLVIEPLADIPAAFDPDEAIEDTIDADEDGGLRSVVRPTPIGAVRIHSRADWGARAPRCSGGSMTPNRATIHHTVTPTNDSMSPQARLRQIQGFHINSRGWCDIGYNYLISRDGRVWRGRGAGVIGAHVTNNNTGNVGVSFIGTHTSTAPTATQMCSAARLLRRLHEDHGALSLSRSDVKGHRQYGGTSCPGAALYSRIDKILRKARNGCSTE